MNVAINAPSTALAMLGSALSLLAPWHLVPSFQTREGLFFAAEGLFLLLSATGLVMYLRAGRNRPVLLLWFLRVREDSLLQGFDLMWPGPCPHEESSPSPNFFCFLSIPRTTRSKS